MYNKIHQENFEKPVKIEINKEIGEIIDDGSECRWIINILSILFSVLKMEIPILNERRVSEWFDSGEGTYCYRSNSSKIKSKIICSIINRIHLVFVIVWLIIL